MQLVEMFVHPLKSCRGISYSRAYASKQGLLHDREWLLAGDNGRFSPRARIRSWCAWK